MSSQQQVVNDQAASAKRMWPRWLAVILGMVILAVGTSVAWWFNRPVLEPLPSIATEHLEPELRKAVSGAITNAAFHSRSAAAWGNLGTVYFVHNFEAQSQTCFRNAERLAPGDYRWPYLLGVSLIYTDGEQMMAAYQRAAKLCGKRAHVQLRLAEALLDRGELADAAVQIDQVLAYAPTSPRAQFAKARLFLAQGKLPEAKAWAQKSVEGDAGKRAPQMLLAHLCRRTQDAPGEATALAAIAQMPDGFTSWEDPDVAAILSLRLDHSSRLARAEAMAQSPEADTGKEMLFEMTRGNDGSSAAALLARTLNREGKSREAEALARNQLTKSPNDERLHFQLAAACFQQEKYAEAETALRRVIKLKPDYIDAWNNLGLTLLKLNKPSEARDIFASTVRYSPSRVSARIHLAELLMAEGKNEEAREHLEAASRLAPEKQDTKELLSRLKSGGK